MVKYDWTPLEALIYKRIVDKNKNIIWVINGGTGSGKSYASIYIALKLAYMFDTEFTIKKNMAFSFVELLKKMKLPGNDQKGTVFLLEEAGAMGSGAASRQWQTKANIAFDSFLQTSRHRNQVFLMNCPMFSMLDMRARSLAHLQGTMVGVDPSRSKAAMKVFKLQTNAITGKQYTKYIRGTKKGVRTKLNPYVTSIPPLKVREEYELLKTKYTDKLNDEIIALEKPASKAARVDKRFKITADDIIHLQEKGWTLSRIAEFAGLAVSSIKRIKGIAKSA